MLDEAVVVLVERARQAFLKPGDLVFEDLVLVDFVLHALHLVGDIVISIFYLIIVFSLLFLQLYLFVLEHLVAGLLACRQLCQLVALGLDDHFLHGERLLRLALCAFVLVEEVLVLAVVADPDELVGVLVLPLLPDVLEADRVFAELAKWRQRYQAFRFSDSSPQILQFWSTTGSLSGSGSSAFLGT